MIPILVNSIAFASVIVKEERKVTEFNRISLEGYGNVILTQNGSETLIVEANKDLMHLIETKVRNNTLHLKVKSGLWQKIGIKDSITYYINVNSIEGLFISGSGNITADNIESKKLVNRISGSGSISVESIHTRDLNIEISGSGDCYLNGETNNQSISISGSGSYDGINLISEVTSVTVSGSGKATVWVEKEFDVIISGSGAVEYRGDPKNISSQKSGSGSIRKFGGSLK